MAANPSSPSWPLPLFADSDFTVAQPCGLPVLSSPIPSINSSAPVSPSTPGAITASNSFCNECTLTQQWMQYRSYFVPQKLNTLHPDFSSANGTYTGPNFYLVAESERQDMGGGVVRWTRTYAIVPPSWDDWETYQYSFIGLVGFTSGSVAINGRNRVSRLVPSRLRHDYFLVDPSLSSDSPPTYASPGNIPKVWAMQYCSQIYYSGNWYGSANNAVDTLTAGAPQTLPSYGTTAGQGYTSGTFSGGLGSSTVVPCYEAMCIDAALNGWGATITKIVINNGVTGAYLAPSAVNMSSSVFGGQIPAEDSRIVRWQGNIWMRATRYVLAQ